MRPVPLHAAIGLVAVGALAAIASVLAFGFLFPAAASDVATLAGAQGVGVLAALALGLRWFEPKADLRTALRVEPVPTPVAVLSLAVGLLLYVPLTEMGNAGQHVFPLSARELATFRQILEPPTAARALVALVATVVVAPLTEEALFRGFLLRGLRRAHGPAVALVATSLLFALAHASLWRLPPAFAAGLALGAVSLAARSTVPALLAHGAYNAVPFLLPARLVRLPGLNVVDGTPQHQPVALVVATAILAVGAALALWRLAARTRGRTA